MTQPPLTRRQHQIVEFLRSYTEEHGFSPTLEEIAQGFGVNKVTIFGHVAELERKGVLTRAQKGVSRALRLVEEVELAVSARDAGAASGGSTPTPAPQRGASLQVLGRIAAGSPIEALEAPEDLDLLDLVPRDRECYALRVQGDSMIEDAIRDGDIVLVERRSDPRNGETVVAVLPDGDTTLKRYYKERGGVRLQPANASMQPIRVPAVEVRGVVIGVVRRL